MKNNIWSRFESLPNELVYEIFYYIDGLELYRAFYNLNSRINNILNSISNISLQLNSLTDAGDPFVDRFARHVVYLNIPRPNCVDATRFSNVCFLEFFDFLCQQQLTQVRHKHFGQLVYLRMCYIEDSDVALAFFQMLFSNEFPSLCKCILDEITPPDLHHQWSSSPSIHSLIVSGLSLPLYFLILASCSNLTHLHWSAMRYTDEDIQSISVRHTHPKRLYFRTINIQNIESILTRVPNLMRLHTVSDWSRGSNCLPLDFEQLVHILVRCVPCLHRFECETTQRNPINIGTIRGFHPCFGCIQCERLVDGRTRFFTTQSITL